MSIPCKLLLKLRSWGLEYPYTTTSDEEPVATIAADDANATTSATTVQPLLFGQGPLHAWVSISSTYTRELIIAALKRRQHLWTVCVGDEEEPPKEELIQELRAASSTSSSAAAASTSSSSSLSSSSNPWPLNLQFCEFERIDWSTGLSSSSSSKSSTSSSSSSSTSTLIVSSYPVRKGLIRKAQLSFLIKKYCSKRPNSILHRTFPETHLMSIDSAEYLEEALNDVYEVRDMIPGQDMWIMKASMINRAQGIHLITCVEDVQRIVEDEQYEEIREWVLQRYIQHPLLIAGGRKFHIRVYILVVGNMRVFLWNKQLCLIAPEKYVREETQNLNAHITNTCYNTDHPDFREEDYIKLLDEVLTPDEFTKVQTQMKETVHDIFSSLHSEPTVFLPLPNSFELFGCDFLLDQDKNLFFLEANAGPDFAMTGVRLQKIVEGMMEETMKLAVDEMVEKACKKEGVELPKPTEQQKQQVQEEEKQLVGQFVECYNVQNSATVSMNFY